MESVLAPWSTPSFTDGFVLNDSVSTTTTSISNNLQLHLPPLPSPIPIRSPTLYQELGDDESTGTGNENTNKYVRSAGLSRSQLAQRVLQDIEEGREAQYPQSELLGEEFVNLELFQDLEVAAAYDYDSDLGGNSVSESGLGVGYLDRFYESPVTSPALSEEFPDESYDQLTAEFQSILDSLPDSNLNFLDFSEDAIELVEDIVMDMDIGIKDELLEQMEMESGDESNNSNGDETAAADAEVEEQKPEGESIEIYYHDYDTSSQSQTSYSEAEFITAEDSESDAEANVSEKILDALLDGNLKAAESYMPVQSTSTNTAQVPVQLYTIVPVNLLNIAPATASSAATTDCEEAPKKSRKNSTSSSSKTRSPKTSMKKPRLSPRVDRVERKKEQNKTAATRYREKKKVLATIVSQQEQELADINSKLAEEKKDLGKQIAIVKQLLRDVISAKKKNQRVSRRK